MFLHPYFNTESNINLEKHLYNLQRLESTVPLFYMVWEERPGGTFISTGKHVDIEYFTDGFFYVDDNTAFVDTIVKVQVFKRFHYLEREDEKESDGFV